MGLLRVSGGWGGVVSVVVVGGCLKTLVGRAGAGKSDSIIFWLVLFVVMKVRFWGGLGCCGRFFVSFWMVSVAFAGANGLGVSW